MKQTKHLFLVLITLLISGVTLAQSDIPNRPNPPRLVNDFTQTLSQPEVNALERKLVQFDNQTSNQIVVVFVKNFAGYSKAEYADLIGEKWDVGRKLEENGIVLLIKPKTFNSKGEVHIAISNGLGGVIPDAIAKRIVEYEMIPSLKQNDYYTALQKSTSVLMGLAKKEFSSNDYKKKTSSGKGFGFLVPIFAILFFVFMSRGRGSNTYGSRGGGSSLLMMMMMGSMMGGGRAGGSFSDFSGGSGGFGGFGGGGGGFGGGGAGGSW